jgi:hypothetical protein
MQYFSADAADALLNAAAINGSPLNLSHFVARKI